MRFFLPTISHMCVAISRRWKLARGFKEKNINEMRKDSPNTCKNNFSVILLIIVINKRKVCSLDINLHFHRKINLIKKYLKLIYSGTSKLWKINISVCGFCDAPHSRYLSLKLVLLKAGAIKVTLMIPYFVGMIRVKFRTSCVVTLIFVGEWTKIDSN